MSTTLTSLSSILKNQYIGPLREQLNNELILLNRLEKDSESVVGKNFTIPLHYGRNEGVGARAESASLPTAGQQGYKEAIVPMKYLYCPIEITGQTIKASRSNEGAFLRAVDSEMKGATRDLKSSMNRMLYGDSTGVLTTCGTTSNATTVVVDSTKYLRAGMVIDILVKSTGATITNGSAVTIATIASATTFTVGAAVTTDNTHGVYINGSRNNEIQGLSGIVATTDTVTNGLHGLAVASYPWWVATVNGNSSVNRAISEVLLQKVIDDVESAGSGKISAMYTGFGVRRAYQALLTSQKIYQNVQKFNGGYEALTYNNLPIFADKDCQPNKLYMVDESMLKWFQMSESGFEWMEEDGNILNKVPGYDKYSAVLFNYCELGCMARNAHGRIDDLAEATA